ncbi:MAG: efflux RND transporter periplasmic adaptor subunit [Cellvibrionaceae bacterium]|nr:efflux RND transporter periplasmic adaptor subunit [Cellvibrionaceae bacterium]
MQQQASSRRGLFLTLIILLVGAAAIVAVATLKPKPAPKPKEDIKPPQVKLAPAEPGEHRLSVHSQGTVAPRREINLVAEVSGRITKVSEKFVAGGFVEAGEILVEIDPRDYRFALVQAESQVAEARQRLATERGHARQKKREWRDLGNKEANDLFLRKPQIAAAEAALAAAEANRDKAKLSLARTRISLPFAGRIRSTKVDLGQFVNPGTPVAQAYDTSVLEVRLPLTDGEAALLDLPLGSAAKAGPKVVLQGQVAGEMQQWLGQITRTEASLDTRSRLYYAVAEVNEPFAAANPLMVGLFVEAEIAGRALANVIELPKNALYKRKYLYWVDADNKIRRESVRVMKTGEHKVWVKAELPQAAQVVLGGQQFLAPGKEVAPEWAEGQSKAGRAKRIADKAAPLSASSSASEEG